MNKLTLYVSKDLVRQLRLKLLLHDMSISEWFRRKAQTEVDKAE